MSKVFIFIDESGDAGKHTDSASSKYYQLNIVLATREMLEDIALQFSRFRFFTDAKKELDNYLRWKWFDVILDIFTKLHKDSGVRNMIFRIEKENYVWPYYQGSEHNAKKFRNFIIRIALEHLFSMTWIRDGMWTQVAQIPEKEIIIDRFLENRDDEENLQKYLMGNYHLSYIQHITQIDSQYSEHLQYADVLGKLVKRYIEHWRLFTDLNFVKMFDISNPRSALILPENPNPPF
jgi:Protein of unknown function (DUF3800)